MKTTHIHRSVAAAFLLVGASCHTAPPPAPPQPEVSPPVTGNAAVPNTLTNAERAAGWRLLFDGRTGAGWRGYRQAALPAGWQVKDGALTRVGAGGGLITKQEFKKFWLALQWETRPRG